MKFIKLLLKKITNNLKKIIILTMDECVNFFIKKNISLENKNILLVRVDLIGDAIIWFYSAEEYKKVFPDYKITLICNYLWKELAEELNCFDEIIPIDTKRFLYDFKYRIEFLKLIRKNDFEIVYNTSFSREFLLDDSIVRCSKSKKKYGFFGDYCKISYLEKKISNNWYSKLLFHEIRNKHEIERNEDFIRFFINNNFQSNRSRIELFSDKNQKNKNKKYFIIAPGTSDLRKAWEKEKFIECIKYILKNSSLDCILCGSKSEKELCSSINNSIQSNRITDISGETSFEELCILIKGAEFVIGNDSAILHLSVLFKVKNICILNGVHFGRFFPYKDYNEEKINNSVYKKYDCSYCDWKFSEECKESIKKYGKYRCIKNIEVKDVIEKVEFLMK